MKLSILIPTIRRHEKFLTDLLFELRAQILPYAGEVEILIDNHEYDLIGVKRNRLLERATGDYLCFFDADDMPGDNYIEQQMKGVASGCDCASLLGVITWDGEKPEYFEHSIKYERYETVEGNIKYLRYPNHLNLIKSSIAKQFKFPKINHGEDTDWATQIHESGLLQTEYYIPEVIYFYRYISKK